MFNVFNGACYQEKNVFKQWNILQNEMSHFFSLFSHDTQWVFIGDNGKK
jgi:hypothetical protein